MTEKLVHITETRCGKCKHLTVLGPPFYRRKKEAHYCCDQRIQNAELDFAPTFFAEKCVLYEAKTCL